MRDLTPNEKALLDARLDSVIYTCGAEGLFEEGHQLEKKLFISSRRSSAACRWRRRTTVVAGSQHAARDWDHSGRCEVEVGGAGSGAVWVGGWCTHDVLMLPSRLCVSARTSR